MYTHSKEDLQNLTPQKAFQYLKEGNERFIRNLRANRDLLRQVNETRAGQHPFAVILSCMDSRTSAELIFDQGLGDIFSIRIAGNVLNEDIIGSMEFATNVVGSKIVVVLGHTQCGAIKGACDAVEMGYLTQLLEKVKPAIDRETSTPQGERNSKNGQFVETVTNLNVQVVIEQLREKSPIISGLLKEGKIAIVGGVYSVETGKVDFFDEA